jgi:DNA-binding response OmpR family regulator
VLVVDDDPSIRTLLAIILEESGFQVFAAADGREARAAIAEYSIDLVITDLAMPGEEGIELIRSLKKQYSQLKVVVMSGAFGSEVFDAAILLGANAALTKPLTAEKVLRCIRGLSASRK